VKLPVHRTGLPGKELSFYIVPLDPAYPARAGRGTCRSKSFYSFVTSESQVLSPGDALIVDWGMRIAEFSNLRLILRQAQDAAW